MSLQLMIFIIIFSVVYFLIPVEAQKFVSYFAIV